MALLSYGVYGGISEEEKGTGVGEIVGGALTAVYAKNLILKKAGLEETFLKEQVKISLAASDFSEKNIIDLKVMSRISGFSGSTSQSWAGRPARKPWNSFRKR